MEYDIVMEPPTPREFVHLRSAAGMRERSLDAARAGIGDECAAVTIRADGDLVGMGRIVGDGATVFQIVDIAVAPDHQGRGLGSRIMNELVSWLEANVPPSAFINLIASEPAFYEEFDFETCAPELVGMDLTLPTESESSHAQ
ncbi:GNAT family N-acetyltransferase [Halococcus saccharolyticus]|uniref:AttT protein n=1 Tax=Halococcus saccharolyticus DSM 5350 TaxID=1227455 RepID=M0MJS7_9EURY|nr:GNAT family N-acetyltransferase [Halococcus saccharolyticus]EMA44700.1 AttT protein [Halococcus saccharolyticus DSM 5350]